jgi:hypothetical protein
MTYQKQIDANRRNSLLSTGPKSPEALAALRDRARRHSLSGAHIVLPYEKAEDYDSLRADLFHDYAPASTQECILVDGIAQAHWKLQRANRLEVAQLTTEFNAAMAGLKMVANDDTKSINPDRALAMAISQDPVQLVLLQRYTTTIERSLQRFIRDLHTMQKERRRQEQKPNQQIGFELQNKKSDPQPAPKPNPTTPPLSPAAPRYHQVEGKWVRKT